MFRKSFLCLLVAGCLSALSVESGDVRANPNEQSLKQEYDAFVASLNHRQLAEDYPGAVRNLDSPDPKQQIIGIKTLAATDEIRAIPWIVPFLDSQDRHVRIYAGQALSAIVASNALKRRDKTQPDRVVILPPGPDDVDLRPVSWVIQKMLRMPDDGNTHAFAANMIGYLGIPQYTDELRQLLTSRHPAVSSAATRALEMLGVQVNVSSEEPVATPIQEIALDLSRLRGWGTRSFTYQVEQGGERTSLGTVTMAVELLDEAIKLTDTWDLLWHGKRVRLNLETTCRSNSLLRPTMIRSAGEGDDEVGTFTVVVGESDATVTTEDGNTHKTDFPADTLTDVAMFRIFTLLPTTKGVTFSMGHVMELSELNLKGPAAIVCCGLQEISVSGRKLKWHKFVYRRDGRTVAEAWVDSDHILRQLRLDGRKVLTEKQQ